MEVLVSRAGPGPPALPGLSPAPLQRQLVFQTGLRKPLLAMGCELPVVLALSLATWASASLGALEPYNAQTCGLAKRNSVGAGGVFILQSDPECPWGGSGDVLSVSVLLMGFSWP